MSPRANIWRSRRCIGRVRGAARSSCQVSLGGAETASVAASFQCRPHAGPVDPPAGDETIRTPPTSAHPSSYQAANSPRRWRVFVRRSLVGRERVIVRIITQRPRASSGRCRRVRVRPHPVQPPPRPGRGSPRAARHDRVRHRPHQERIGLRQSGSCPSGSRPARPPRASTAGSPPGYAPADSIPFVRTTDSDSACGPPPGLPLHRQVVRQVEGHVRVHRR